MQWAMNSDTEIIYVRLLDEGTDVFRPVNATPLVNGTFKIDMEKKYESDDERWEFEPGSVVVCKHEVLSGENVLIASALDNSVM